MTARLDHRTTADADESSAQRAWRGSVRRLGLADYVSTWRAMREFTDSRSADTPDELWLLEHPPVYTYGVAGRVEHLPHGDTAIPVIKTDRGGQVTYHGPGQAIAYALIDLRRARLTVRSLVGRLEQAVLDLLQDYDVRGERRAGAPGIYVGGAKVAALGLRIRSGRSYHGLSLNVDLDLAPFAAIDPCGYPGLAVTRLRDLGIVESVAGVSERLAHHLIEQLCRP
jgi:lipoyl(octanoyl) transferase